MAAYTLADFTMQSPQGHWTLKARANLLKLERENASAITQIYDDAAVYLSGQIRKVGNPWDEQSLRQMKRSIAKQREQIGKSLRERLIGDTHRAAQNGTLGFQGPLFENLTGMDTGGRFTRMGLTTAFANTSNLAVAAMWGRAVNGLLLSERIWQSTQAFQTELTRLVNVAAASGMGSVELSKLIEKLAREGGHQLKSTILADYPNAARRFGRHFPKTLNWEALRLARTELAFAYNSAAVMAGRQTPGYEGCRWLLANTHPKEDICDEYASADPDGLGPGCYKKGNEPVYAHPNCLCTTVPILMPREEFTKRLSSWVRGDSWPEMDHWYKDVYLGAQR